MPGLYLSRSNRLEMLAEGLAERLRKPIGSPLQAECVVVQSLGMRRWLSLELAQRLGVVMNFEFPFPAAFFERVFNSALGVSPESALLTRDILPWRILALFPELLGKPRFAELLRYVEGSNRGLKEYQLAQRIAGVMDRCLAWRPELINAWDAGEDDSWLAEIWRALSPSGPKAGRRGATRRHVDPGQMDLALGPIASKAAVTSAASLPARTKALLRELNDGRNLLNDLPSRISVFGLSSLPPAFLDLFAALSNQLEIHLYLLVPTPDYWSDMRSPREQRSALKRQKTKATAKDLHFETGHDLLAAMGRVGREFAEQIAGLEPVGEADLCVSPDADTLLHRLQSDIFALREARAEAADADDAGRDDALPQPDGSLQVHCCHGPMREVEVLYDRLLELFETLPELEPREVLVTMPDVETYAPFIEAVFGTPEQEECRLPYRIADRSQRAESGLASCFLRLLDLPSSRFGAASVLGLLETAPLRERFELRESDTGLIHSWIERSGIRWGLDAAHRGQFDLPIFAQNSWREGLDRLLLGYALPGDERSLFAGILPVREVEGEGAAVLGRFVEFADKIAGLPPALSVPLTLKQWTETLRKVLEDFFADDDQWADELREVRRVVDSLAQVEDLAGLNSPITFEVVRRHLLAAFASTESGLGFLSGAITFCALKPLRSIPFRVVCMLGMNDGAFPRHDAPLPFDPMGRERKPGDRTLRDDDRWLFLETILSARDVLYLSYSGRSPRDNSESPPSAAVSALLDAVARHAPSAQLVINHPLQAFSRRCFSPEIGSYSAQNHAACVRGARPRVPPPVLGAESLPDPDWTADLDLHEFIEFFCHPQRVFARERLGVRLPSEESALLEREPMEQDGLSKFELRREIIDDVLAARTPVESLAILRARGALAPGLAGEVWHAGLWSEAKALAKELETAMGAAKLPPLEVDLRCGGRHLTGCLRDIFTPAMLRYRAAKISAKDRLRAWIGHVVLNATAPPKEYPRSTWLYGLAECRRYQPVEEPLKVLETLLALYAEGMRQPLRFYPKTSLKFAEKIPSVGPEKARKLAADVWTPFFSDGRGESDDAWVHYLLHNEPQPLDRRWEEVACAIFGPMLAHEQAPKD